MTQTNIFRGLTYSIVFSLVLLLGFGVVLAENNNGNTKDKDNKTTLFSNIKNREEWKIPGGEPRVEINPSGHVLVRGAKIISISGNDIVAKVSFGSPEISWKVVTNSTTGFGRLYGGATNINEFSVGDVISFSGSLVANATTLTVEAKALKNWSIQKARANIVGTVGNIDSGTKKFTVTTKDKGLVTVETTSSTTFKKEGSATTTFSILQNGDKVEAQGLYNNNTKVLSAEKVFILKKDAVKPPKTFEGGTLKSISSATTPATLVVEFKGINYTVSINADTSLLNNVWAKIVPADLRVGDKIRVYGAETVATSTVLVATVVRDTSIPR